MNNLYKIAALGLLAFSLSNSALASDKVNNAIIGAGLGAAAGAILSEGDPAYILGGAAAGGVLGHVFTEDNKSRHKRYKHYGHKNYKQVAYNNGYYSGHHKHSKKYKKYKKHYYR